VPCYKGQILKIVLQILCPFIFRSFRDTNSVKEDGGNFGKGEAGEDLISRLKR
jgi:hypothetical protein